MGPSAGLQIKGAPRMLAGGFVHNVRAAAGGSLTGCWLGEDLGAVGADVVTWTARVGPALVNRVAAKFKVTQTAGRKGILTPDTKHKLLYKTDFQIAKSLICVAGAPTLPSGFNYGLLLGGTFSTGPYAAGLLVSGGSTWYSASNWTHYRDGEASEAAAAGVHIYQADKATNDAIGIGVGSWSEEAPWTAPIYCLLAFDAVPSASVRAMLTGVLRKYYKGVLA